MKKISAAVALGLGVAFAGMAQAANEVPGTLPTALQIAVQGGMKIEKTFEAEGGMTGWVLLSGNGNYAIAYTPPSGDVVIAGTMLSSKGEDLTKAYLAKYGNYDKFLPELEKADAITVGAKGDQVKSTIYAFLDSNCIFCHHLHNALQPYLAAGLQVKWIPVGILGGSSPGQAAALMAAADPEAALNEHHQNWEPRAGKPGITPIAVSQEFKAKLDANVALMESMGGSGTPMIVYKDERGHWQKANGMPRLGELPGITGLPEQQITDPQLQRFR